MNNKFNSLFLIICLVCSFNANSQETRKDLEQNRKEIQNEINKISTLLSEAVSEEKSLLSRLNDTNIQIRIQEELIAAINAETEALNIELKKNAKEIKSLRAELKELKDDYAKMIYKSYKSKSQNSRIMFIMSSDNFYQAYKRIQYMKQYTIFRKAQGIQISKKAVELGELNDTLEKQKLEKEILVNDAKIAHTELEKKKSSENEIIAKIKMQERKYKAEIRKKRKEQKTINDKIEQLIKDEITKANLKTGKTSSGFVLTAEAKLIATKFEGNKDKLPWPVEKGFVSRRFGKQKHPTLQGILVESNGVRITTELGASARAVFEGTIMQIQSVSGKKAIYIRHGNYITVYNNLETVFVKKGDNVATKQTLGKVYTDKVTNKTVLKFQVWKNATRLNPASWIYKM